MAAVALARLLTGRRSGRRAYQQAWRRRQGHVFSRFFPHRVPNLLLIGHAVIVIIVVDRGNGGNSGVCRGGCCSRRQRFSLVRWLLLLLMMVMIVQRRRRRYYICEPTENIVE